MARVCAVEQHSQGPPVEAILFDSTGNPLRWWGGRAWETLDPSEVDEALSDASAWTHVDLALPDDWEDGYLDPTGGLHFEYGSQPRRQDWESKSWTARIIRRVRSLFD